MNDVDKEVHQISFVTISGKGARWISCVKIPRALGGFGCPTSGNSSKTGWFLCSVVDLVTYEFCVNRLWINEKFLLSLERFGVVVKYYCQLSLVFSSRAKRSRRKVSTILVCSSRSLSICRDSSSLRASSWLHSCTIFRSCAW